ncbi:helix-turn-helix domain-containing protein [Amycolatopsis sp. NPDC051716]|uniref:helix-turn-helix domain-containing protein n=1 Tax=Amycolatopsis sp. NPDC051716 TaxID=3155804 RepID=UPI0034422EC7
MGVFTVEVPEEQPGRGGECENADIDGHGRPVATGDLQQAHDEDERDADRPREGVEEVGDVVQHAALVAAEQRPDQDALSAQALIVRLGSARRFTAYADVELIDALTKDRASARRFVVNTLGPLAEADPELRRTLITYVQCGFNTSRAAAGLYAHRNTVERRVSRANDLAVVKVEDNPTHVAAALLVLDVAPGIMAG